MCSSCWADHSRLYAVIGIFLPHCSFDYEPGTYRFTRFPSQGNGKHADTIEGLVIDVYDGQIFCEPAAQYLELCTGNTKHGASGGGSNIPLQDKMGGATEQLKWIQKH
jgi:hypothetical protein